MNFRFARTRLAIESSYSLLKEIIRMYLLNFSLTPNTKVRVEFWSRLVPANFWLVLRTSLFFARTHICT